MLEISIIVCLAIILFLVLRHFPETNEATNETYGEKNMNGFWQKIFIGKQRNNEKNIEAAILKGQEKIIAPVEVNNAQKDFLLSDPEIAKLLLNADDAFLAGDLRGAEDMAIEAITKDKKCSQAYVVIGKIALSRGAFNDARESFKVAIKCNPEIGEAYFGLGEADLREENFSKAILNLQSAVSLNRGVALWHAELGKAYMQVRQFAKAAKSFKKAANLDIETKEYKNLATEAENKQRTHSSVFRYK